MKFKTGQETLSKVKPRGKEITDKNLIFVTCMTISNNLKYVYSKFHKYRKEKRNTREFEKIKANYF